MLDGLSPTDVEKLVESFREGTPKRMLAERYGISESSVKCSSGKNAPDRLAIVCHDAYVDLSIRIIDDPSGDQLEKLAEWLRTERDLQGRVRLVRREISQQDLGAGFDALSVAVGSGGVGVALTQSLSAWLRSRRSDIKLIISSESRKIEVDGHGISNPREFIAQILQTDQFEDPR